MRDVQSWRALHEPHREAIVTALRELAEIDPVGRVAFWSAIARLGRHPDPEIRAAAVAAMGGARARGGVQRIVAALDDDDPSVRRAAVGALRRTAATAPMRWAHALFHPRDDVRRACFDDSPPSHTANMYAYLRTDPAVGEAARALALPPNVGLVFDLYRRGVVSPTEAGEALGRLSGPALSEFLKHAVRRTPEQTDAFLDAALSNGTVPEATGVDDLDTWLEMVQHAPDRRAAFSALGQAVVHRKTRDLRRRCLVSLVARGDWEGLGEPAWTLAAACDPLFLALPCVPGDVRRGSVAGLETHRQQVGRVSAGLIERLMRSPLMRRRGGVLDVGLAAAVTGLYEQGRIVRLVDHFGMTDLLEGLRDDLRGWLIICRYPAESGRRNLSWLLDRIEKWDRPRYHELLAAALVGRAGATVKAFGAVVRRVDGGQCAAVAQALIRMTTAGQLKPTTKGVTRIVRTLDEAMPAADWAQVVATALAAVIDPEGSFAVELVRACARRLEPSAFTLVVAGLDREALTRLADLAEIHLALPRDREMALVRAMTRSGDPELAARARTLIVGDTKPPPPPRPPVSSRSLTTAEADRISTCDASDLTAALAPALSAPTQGLVSALEHRTGEVVPNRTVCAALIGCVDDLTIVAEQFERFWEPSESFMLAVEHAVTSTWFGRKDLPAQAHAFLYRWERHLFALSDRFEISAEGFTGFLRYATQIPATEFRVRFWEASAALVQLWRYRQPALVAAVAHPELYELLLDHLDTEVGPSAAKLLVAIAQSGYGGEALDKLRPRVREMAPDMGRITRHELYRFVRLDGLAGGSAARSLATPAQPFMEKVRRSTDLDFLEKTCHTPQTLVVHEAALRLLELGAAGEARLVRVLRERPAVRRVVAVIESVPLWSDPDALAEVRSIAADPEAPAEIRFRLAMALTERHETGWIEPALVAARQPMLHDDPWFRTKDWDTVVEAAGSTDRVATALAAAPHPHAYQKAVAWLLARPLEDADALAAIREFLDQGTERPTWLRRAAARRLHEAGDLHGLVVLVAEATAADEKPGLWLVKGIEPLAVHDVIHLVADAALVGGRQVCPEQRLLELTSPTQVPADVRNDVLVRLLHEGMDPRVRNKVVAKLQPSVERDRKLTEIAGLFAWGVRRGRELTGRLFRVHMTHRREDFGYTYLDESRIFVTPLPVLRGDRDGHDIVRGLILHEYGHHRWHRGPDAKGIWNRAQREGIHHILNLVADEHLERNLRSIDAEYGDYLKRLGAYAFQHNGREIEVSELLKMLGGAAFEALSTIPLGVAFKEDCVELRRGHLLRELARVGHPFARFVRALRMGLGNRQRDPLVEEALALFRDGFRHRDMAGLYDIARRISQMFGVSSGLASKFGGHESLGDGDREGSIHGDKIKDDEVQREVERILDPRQLKNAADKGKPGRLAINVNPDEKFDRITNIEPVSVDPDKHREVANHVRRHADRLRQYLTALGLALVPRRARLRGRAFDRTRARAVVLRRDPRMLVAREIEIDNDLFIGVVVDCSGSMNVGESMTKATHFGVLIAEAVAALPGVDARFFGFTDRLIYDAGDAQRCAVTSLKPGGGNNDAAALYHAAQVAASSRRKARLLVMISDGLPTECSVAALRGLVFQLTRRRGILCAQVAVRPLEEVCFPHYVVLESPELDRDVRKFGEIVSGLARRALGR